MPAAPLAAAATGLPRTFLDLEDQILRVRWMSEIANDQLQMMPAAALCDEYDKLCHLVRATSELAVQLYRDFQVAQVGRTAA